MVRSDTRLKGLIELMVGRALVGLGSNFSFLNFAQERKMDFFFFQTDNKSVDVAC